LNRSDYAECQRRFARVLRVNRDRRGITLGSALCVLCRYRHKGHWSGHETRLKRELSTRFGSESYAAEELVAELTSAFLCAELGVQGELRHSGYIGHWIKLLKSDPRAIFTAASKASQAADYLRSLSEARNEVPCLG
jgi:antirestriction protein ArdC